MRDVDSVETVVPPLQGTILVSPFGTMRLS